MGPREGLEAVVKKKKKNPASAGKRRLLDVVKLAFLEGYCLR